MAALDFPAAPMIGDIYVAGDRSWQWNGESWLRIPGVSGGINALDEGVQVVSRAHVYNFTGVGTTVTAVGRTAVITVPAAGTPATLFWGNGEDGAADLDGANTYSWCTKDSAIQYTLDRPVQLTDLIIRVGVTLRGDGWNIYCNGTVTCIGSVSVAGFPAVGGTAGAVGMPVSGRVYGPSASAGGGGPGTGGINGGMAEAAGGQGGRGGAGSFSAGALNGYSVIPETWGGPAFLASLRAMQTGFGGGIGWATTFRGANGGTGGGGNGVSSAGGGGGAGGNGAAAGCGGGGGGGGGVAWLLTTTQATTINVTAAGGAGGGGPGNPGNPGGDGRAYKLFVF